jgi:hypothetical protein
MSLAEAFLYRGLEGRPYRQRKLSPGVQNSLDSQSDTIGPRLRVACPGVLASTNTSLHRFHRLSRPEMPASSLQVTEIRVEGAGVGRKGCRAECVVVESPMQAARGSDGTSVM